jgi:putative flavoprotein involved in K+ transport
MNRTDAIIIGGGQAGLAMSRALSLGGIEHVVLERGRVGERWHSERWNSLHLLTTAAYSALPGLPHEGDRERFMPAADFAGYLDRYAGTFAVPIVTNAEVKAVDYSFGGYHVETSDRCWYTRAVIIATGACDMPHRPAGADLLPRSVTQIVPASYRAPDDLPDGKVLVVGASSTGVQLAEEIHRSGRPVTIAAGDHTRMVRRYRGRDIFERMDMAGILNDPFDDRGNPQSVRRQPSIQLIGREDGSDLGLHTLDRLGVRLVGRLGGIEGGTLGFHGDLEQTTLKSHKRLIGTLQRIDDAIAASGKAAPPSEIGTIEPFLRQSGAATINLRRDGIRSIVWATGYRRCYDWLNIPVVAADGEVSQRGGVTASPGVFTLGLNFQRRRRSHFIDGCGADAEDIAKLVQDHLRGGMERAA